MCHQEDNNLEILKGQVLTDIELGKIEAKLDDGWNASQIARYLNRDDSGIRSEIRNFSIIKMPGCNFDKRCKQCKSFNNCNKKMLCDTVRCRGIECKKCYVAPEKCCEYIPEISCKYLKGHKKVCNGCPKKSKCIKPKRIYSAKESSKQHLENRKNSVKKEKALNQTEYLQYIADRIKLGQSPEVILNTPSKDYGITLSVPTVYSYIDKQIIPCLNIDLRNKVKRRVKTEKRRASNNLKHREKGRSYHDLSQQAKGKTEYGNMQMDTVEGVKGEKVLLTLLEKSTSFLFGLPMEDKKQISVLKQINKLHNVLNDEFLAMFKTLLTDNGVEFLNFTEIEQSPNGEKRTSIYYADPYASYQKGSIENQHRLIRYFFPKSVDFGLFSDEIIIEQINKINNYPRKELGWKTPYQMLCKRIDPKILGMLGFYYIPIEKLDMKTRKVA